jgi:hypothetical protein
MKVLMIKLVSIAETSVNFHQATGCSDPEDGHILCWRKIINMHGEYPVLVLRGIKEDKGLEAQNCFERVYMTCATHDKNKPKVGM